MVVTQQHEINDPIMALENHAHVNNCSRTDTIAFFRNMSGLMIGMTVHQMLRRLNEILANACHPHITGHCFCIGGTTYLLLQGVFLDVVKLIGRWTLDVFLHYWRSLEIIAPMYIELLKPVLAHLDCHRLW